MISRHVIISFYETFHKKYYFGYRFNRRSRWHLVFGIAEGADCGWHQCSGQLRNKHTGFGRQFDNTDWLGHNIDRCRGRIAVGSGGTSAGTGGSSATSASSAAIAASRASIIAQKELEYPMAKEFVDPTGFINSAPFTLSSLVGKKVVLIDFWTYSCINCVRTIPYLNAWYAKYKNEGLEIVGVHTPEFDFEKDYSNVAAAVQQLGIQYPVVLDSNMGTWDAYQNIYWPADYLIDIDGFIPYTSVGEGDTTKPKRLSRPL